jgi:alkylation response protein AidB-like acyl-CoA dehydrogenase
MNYEFTEEQNLIRDSYRKFCQQEFPPEYVRWLDENATFLPEDKYRKLADLGTMGICIPQEYGGMGLGHVEQCIIIEEIATAGVAIGFAASISEGFGGRPIMVLGTEEQKQRHLSRIARGEEKWALAMTEPGGGTDILGAIKTTAVRDGDHYVVNGSKMWISAAHVADYLTTLVITNKEVERKKGLSVLIIDAKSPGITIRPIPKVGIHGCGVNEIFFDDVRVPAENLLGKEDKGWYGLLHVLNPERMGTSIFSLAIAQSAFRYALQYAQERKAFGKTIGSFQILQHYLADIAVEIENARNLIYKCAWLADSGKPYDVEACMAKLVACRASELAARHGMEIMGGYGFAMEYDMQRHFRDYKQMMFSPISDEMAKNYIAESFGLPRSF